MIATSLFGQRMHRILLIHPPLWLLFVDRRHHHRRHRFAMPLSVSHSISNFDNGNVYSVVIIKIILLPGLWKLCYDAKKKHINIFWINIALVRPKYNYFNTKKAVVNYSQSGKNACLKIVSDISLGFNTLHEKSDFFVASSVFMPEF